MFGFRDTIAGVVDSTIRAWRGLARAARELEIGEAALRRAERQFAVNRALIRAGDMAAREILQSEADIANRELALVQARNGLTAANFALIDILDLESSVRVIPLEEQRQQIGIAVRQAVHDVEVGRRRRELAGRARELAEQKLEIERLKLREGLSSSFRLTRFEEDFVRAQNAEVDVQVGYENALTSLDRTLGTTLERWDIRVEQVGR